MGDWPVIIWKLATCGPTWTDSDKFNIIFLVTALRIYTGEYKAQGPT